MIDTPRVSTIDKPERYGGLLICGLNYGLARGANPQAESAFEPWGEYFTHISHRDRDRFVGRLITWFRWWNIALEEDNAPTRLNKAISQTNLFYDSSKSFQARLPSEISEAFVRVRKIIASKNISGLLLTSIQMSSATKEQLGTGEWSVHQSGRFAFKQAMAGTLRVAICTHPRVPLSVTDVANAGGIVSAWFGEVMHNYEKKQTDNFVKLEG